MKGKLLGIWSVETGQDAEDSWAERRRRTLSAGYYDFMTFIGVLLLAFGLRDGNWGLALFGAVAVVFGALTTMHRLRSGLSSKSLIWIAVHVAVQAAGMGVALLVANKAWMILWIFLVVAIGPSLARRVSGVEDAR